MNKLKLMGLVGIFALSGFFLQSCEKDGDQTRLFINDTIRLTGAQSVPPNALTGTGTMRASYNRETKTLNYIINWTNLTDSVRAIHIHGLADAGFIALPAPSGMYPNGIVQNNTTGFQLTSARNGSFAGSLFVDGTVIRETDLLAGKFYVDIHTKTAPYTPTGQAEVRGQITFR
jgi:hypothetical protein